MRDALDKHYADATVVIGNASPELRDVPRQTARAVTLGVLLDGSIQERWVLESLRQALTVPGVKLTAVVLASGNPPASFASRLHALIDRLDEQVRCPKERLFAATDVAAELTLEVVFGRVTDLQ